MNKAYFRCEADGKIYVFEEPASYTVGWRRVTEAKYNKQQAESRPAPTVSSKLQDIRQAVEEYRAYAAKDHTALFTEYGEQDAGEGFFYWKLDVTERYAALFAKALPDLLAIAEAAGELQTILDDLDYGVRHQNSRRKLKDALAKLEGE